MDTIWHRNFDPFVVSKSSPSVTVQPVLVIVPALAPFVMRMIQLPDWDGERVHPATLLVRVWMGPSPGSTLCVDPFVGFVTALPAAEVRKPPDTTWSAT